MSPHINYINMFSPHPPRLCPCVSFPHRSIHHFSALAFCLFSDHSRLRFCLSPLLLFCSLIREHTAWNEGQILMKICWYDDIHHGLIEVCQHPLPWVPVFCKFLMEAIIFMVYCGDCEVNSKNTLFTFQSKQPGMYTCIWFATMQHVGGTFSLLRCLHLSGIYFVDLAKNRHSHLVIYLYIIIIISIELNFQKFHYKNVVISYYKYRNKGYFNE